MEPEKYRENIKYRREYVMEERHGLHPMARWRFGYARLIVILAFLSFAVAGCSDSLGDARALERTGDLAGAVSLYRVFLEKNPNSISALEGLGSDLMILGEYEDAMPVEERLITLDTKDAQTRVELGFNYLNHQNRPADAVRVLREAVNLDDSAKKLTFLGQAQVADDDTVGAETTLRQAMAKDPKYAHAYIVLRDLFVKIGRAQDAAHIEDMARQQGIALESSQ